MFIFTIQIEKKNRLVMAKMWKYAAIILAVVLVWMNWDKIKGMVVKTDSEDSSAAAAAVAALEAANNENL